MSDNLSNTSLRIAGQGRPRTPTAAYAPDCRHYRGDRPCIHNRLCTGCNHYAPFDRRICIIKLGALGDVIRTLCILPELRKQYPNAQITWVSKANGCRMIDQHPQIDRVLEFDAATILQLTAERFDLLINLDKEPQPAAAAMQIDAKKKLGIGLSKEGKPVPLNRQAEHYFSLGLSDELKFCHNEKSYQQLVYEAFGWKYDGQRYELPLCEQSVDRVRLSLASRGWQPGQTSIGIFVGAGKAFANKMWPVDRIIDVIRLIREKNIESQILLLGGPGERKTLDLIIRKLHDEGEINGIVDTGTDHDEPSFVAVIDACDVLFCGDTMAMHVAMALGKGVVAFFGPTCEQEIDFFGRGEALVADVPCGPCYKRVCNENDICVKHIPAEEATAAVLRVLKKVRSGDVSLPVRKTDNKPSRPKREAA